MQQLEESDLTVDERLDRLVVAVDAGCRRSELVTDIEVLRSVAPAGLEAGYRYGRDMVSGADAVIRGAQMAASPSEVAAKMGHLSPDVA